jgi:hypothetical protein
LIISVLLCIAVLKIVIIVIIEVVVSVFIHDENLLVCQRREPW